MNPMAASGIAVMPIAGQKNTSSAQPASARRPCPAYEPHRSATHTTEASTRYGASEVTPSTGSSTVWQRKDRSISAAVKVCPRSFLVTFAFRVALHLAFALCAALLVRVLPPFIRPRVGERASRPEPP